MGPAGKPFSAGFLDECLGDYHIHCYTICARHSKVCIKCGNNRFGMNMHFEGIIFFFGASFYINQSDFDRRAGNDDAAKGDLKKVAAALKALLPDPRDRKKKNAKKF